MAYVSFNKLAQLAYLSLSHNTTVLFILAVVLLAVFGYILWIFFLWYANYKSNLFFTAIQLPVVEKGEVDIAIKQMQTIFSSLHGSLTSQRDRFGIEIIKSGSEISIQLCSNKEEILGEAKRLFSQLRNVTFNDTFDALQHTGNVYVKNLYCSKDFLPIGENPFFFDSLINFLSSLPDKEHAGIQFVLRGVNKKFFIERRIILIERKMKREFRARPKETELRLLEGYNKKLHENLFRTKITVFAADKNDIKTLKSLFQSLNFDTNNWYSHGVFFKRFLSKRFLFPESLFDAIPIVRERNGSYLTSSELAYLFHPSDVTASRYQPEKQHIIQAPPEYLDQKKDNIPIGSIKTLEDPIRPVYFPIANFATHVYIIGKTGRGKSTLLKDMICSLIDTITETKSGNIFVFDPHTELTQEIVIKSTQTKSVFYFPHSSEQKRVFTFNPLFCLHKSAYEKAARRDMLLEIIRSETKDEAGAQTMGTPTLSFIKNAIDIAVEFPDAYFSYLTTRKNLSKEAAEQIVREKQITINDLPFFYIKEMGYTDMFEEIFADVNSPIGRYIKKSLDNDVNQVTIGKAAKYRLDQLIHPSIQLVCEGNSFSLEQAIQSNNTFLFPISESTYGSRGQRLLLKSFLSILWEQKTSVPKEKRVPTYLFMDETQRAQISILPSIISEARKFQLYLTLVNQQLGQLIPEIRDAIAGNMGTIIAFTVGAGEIGARLLSEIFGDEIKENDLVNLPAHSAYLQTENEHHKTIARFIFQTLKPEQKEFDGYREQKLAEMSLQMYGEEKDKIIDRLNTKQENPFKYFTTIEELRI